MAVRSSKSYVYKGKELEQSYVQNLFFAIILAFGIVGFLFFSIRKIDFGTYNPPPVPKPVIVSFAPVIQRIEEEPPPIRPVLNIKIVAKQEQQKDVPSKVQDNESQVLSTNQIENIRSEIDIPKEVEDISLPSVIPADEVYEFFKVEVKPKPIKVVNPVYPELAKKAGMEGRVVISAILDEEGNVIKAEILSSTNSIFNESALKAAYQYKFSPAMMKDRRVKVKVIIPFNFVIK
ncbi:MAG: TonB family protein [candidate division WOR-3 bacterium]|nr:TonB family protein [candidate division WOR-3 bacterium]MCX7948156.1 TonB family protein [candidate division WOR-3 bacterium]MDW8151035.1 TonB family protein [candidate division WOR-3 bacterium]